MNKIHQVLGAGMFLIMSMHTQANIKQHIEKQGFVFVKQIPAPQGMTGWVGHEDQYSNTVLSPTMTNIISRANCLMRKGKACPMSRLKSI